MSSRSHPYTANVITEDVVSSTILSFSSQDFLYTGTVCKSWRQKRGEDTRTSILATLTSCSALQEAFESGMHKSNILDIAIVFNADESVLWHITQDPAANKSTRPCVMNYACFVGNVGAVAVVAASGVGLPLDASHLFDAVRGGHVNMVKHLAALLTTDEINKLPVWRCGWSDHMDMWGVVDLVSGGAGNPKGVEKSIDSFFEENRLRRHPRAVLSCLDAAIMLDKLEIVRVLCEAGATLMRYEYPLDSTQLALGRGNIEMMEYLKNEGLRIDARSLFDSIKTNNREMIQFMLDAGCEVPDRWRTAMFFEQEYFTTIKPSVPVIEFVLDKHLVEVDDLRIRLTLLDPENRPVVELLLSRGYSVGDDTVDDAIEAWDFEFAQRMMQEYGRVPTAAAYKCVLLQGFHHSGVDFEHVDVPACLEKLHWLYALGCPIGFESFARMRSDSAWAFVFAEIAPLSGDVEAFFRARLPGTS